MPRLRAQSSPINSIYKCPRCQLQSGRRELSSTRTLRASKFAILPHRRLLRLSGPDAASFLFDLLPAKILGVGTNPIYTGFLSAQGRILHDVFIYPPSWSGEKSEWFVEVGEEGMLDLLKHLKKHKLRSKFSLSAVDPQEANIVSLWADSPEPGETGNESPEGRHGSIRAGGTDTRPGMIQRLVVDESTENDTMASLLEEGAKEGTPDDYTVHRMLNGLAEGGNEIISAHALPQESNMDFLGGIDFHKGCYLGQELTIRTHHTGVVRKRIVPVQLYDETCTVPPDQGTPVYEPNTKLSHPPGGSNLSKLSGKRGRSTGKWLGGIGNIGLALCRLEMMTDIQLTADSTNYDPVEEYKVQIEDGTEVRLKPFVPPWVRGGIGQSLKRKEKKPQKRQEEEEEYDAD